MLLRFISRSSICTPLDLVIAARDCILGSAFSCLSDRWVCDAINQIGDVRLVIIDPISAYFGNGKTVDAHKNAEVRNGLSPLQVRASKCGIVVIAVDHLKRCNRIEALLCVQGSAGLVAAAHAVFFGCQGCK
jgi:hypothetical protein